MPRMARNARLKTIYHVYNRGLSERPLFESEDELDIGQGLLMRARQQAAVNLFAYCLTPRHWHLLVEPLEPRALSKFMANFTRAHAQLLRLSRCSLGEGYVYRGRFRSYPLLSPHELFRALRFIEGDPVRVGLVSRAEHWRHSSLYHRLYETEIGAALLAPMRTPDGFLSTVNAPLADTELCTIEKALQSGRPLGEGRRYVRKKIAFETATLAPDARFLA